MRAKARGAAHGGSGVLRVIGGQWRGRKLSFPPVPGLRPTPDRVRETLFNWLAPVIDGARCLDLFAGSGALGLEALSRGAREVVWVDAAASVVATLNDHLHTLQAQGGRVVRGDALAFLRGPAEPFDVVFLDPPFGQGLLAPCCTLLAERGWLAPGAWVYLEAERELPEPALPSGWSWHRQKEAGQVAYRLARVAELSAPAP